MNKRLKKLWDLIPLMILWLMVSVFFWGWIFTFLTDAPAENKISLFVDVERLDSKSLALVMEEQLSGDIHMVKVHPFTYAMMDSTPLQHADMFIVPLSKWEEYEGWFRPLPEELQALGPVLQKDNTALGLLVYDPTQEGGAARSYIPYQQEEYYLFFGQESYHIKDNQNAVDDEAIRYARWLLQLP